MIPQRVMRNFLRLQALQEPMIAPEGARLCSRGAGVGIHGTPLPAPARRASLRGLSFRRWKRWASASAPRLGGDTARSYGDVAAEPRERVSILLPSKAQIVLFWVLPYHPLQRCLCAVFGAKHPWALGPRAECWREVWHVLGPLFESVVSTGEAFWAQAYLFLLHRQGFLAETYFDVSYDPVRIEDGSVGGIFCIVSEQTGRVLGERRLRTLRELGTRTATAKSAAEVCREAAAALALDPADMPLRAAVPLR